MDNHTNTSPLIIIGRMLFLTPNQLQDSQHCCWRCFTRVRDRRSATYSTWWRAWSRCPRSFVRAWSSACCRRCCSRRWLLSWTMWTCPHLRRTTSCWGGLSTTASWSRSWLAACSPSLLTTCVNSSRTSVLAAVPNSHDPVSWNPTVPIAVASTRPNSLAASSVMTLRWPLSLSLHRWFGGITSSMHVFRQAGLSSWIDRIICVAVIGVSTALCG